MSTSASLAVESEVVDVCAEQGSPPSGFPSCVWSIPMEGGEVLLDVVGTASASEVRQAHAEMREPKLTPHVLTDEEGALVVEGLLHATSTLSDVVVSELPIYEHPDGDEPVIVLTGRLYGFGGLTRIDIEDRGGGHFTYIFFFRTGGNVAYDTQFGWGTFYPW
ncbi:hypothetical protein HNV26_04200 [Myxococcus xanthus]|nr:hypothetical protein [Myxococcus xanthus]